MSQLNFMEKLLDGVEVEWKALGEVISNVKKIDWSKTNKKYKYIDLSSVDRALHRIIETTQIDSENRPSRAQQIVKNRDVIFGTTRPMLNRFAVIDQEFDGQIASTGFVVLRPNENKILSKFLYFSLTTVNFMNYVEQNQKGAGYPAISDSVVKSYQIPIPPLAIQAEIVRILDTFTALTAELTAELTAREKQYNYYRDQLLTFAEVEWKTLEEMAENFDSMRKPITSSLREPGEIPYYGASGIVDYVKDYIFDGDFLLISEDGANLIARNTPIAFSISGKSWVNNHAHVLKFDTYA